MILGGGTFDLSILELNEGVFQVLSTNGNTRLGGDDLDKRLVDFLVGEDPGAGGPAAARASLLTRRLLSPHSRGGRAGEDQALHRNRGGNHAAVSHAGAFSFSYKLTRAELEKLTRDIIERTRAHCLRALADAKLEAKDLDQVILVGGQTRMPLVRQLVSEWFGCAEFEEERGGIAAGRETITSAAARS